MDQKWYCYICGKKIGKRFCLWSMGEREDRVFLVHAEEKCRIQVTTGNEIYIFEVGEVRRCHRCGDINIKSKMYHSQHGFIAYWYCKDRVPCSKKSKKEGSNG